MKWWLVLVAFVLGLVVTWLLTRRGQTQFVPTSGPPVSASEPLEDDGARQPRSAGATGAPDDGPGGDPDDDQDEDQDEDHDKDQDDDASAFAGAPTEFSSEVGAAEGWHRDAQDEDALLPHEGVQDEDALLAPEPAAAAGQADTDTDAPPVAEATPNGDVAGVGDPEAVRAVDAVEVDAEPAADDTPPRSPAPRNEQGTFTFDTDAAAGDEQPGQPTDRA